MSYPSREAALKSRSPKRAELRPQKLVFPPTAEQRGHIHFVPGAVVYAMSCSQAPRLYSESRKPVMSLMRVLGSPKPRYFISQDMRWFRKSFSGSSRRPEFSAQTLRPASHRVLIAMPPPAPVPIIIPAHAAGDQTVSVSFDVTNTGHRAGAEVAEVYVGETHSSVPRPVKELKGFQKVRLDAGESRHVTVTLDRRAFAYYNVENHDWTVDAGEFSVSVGSSSEQIELTEKIPREPK